MTDPIRFQLDVPLSSECIAGHFPGRPLVPGALLCAAIAGELERRSGEPVIGLAKVRFSAPLAPGEAVVVDCEPRTSENWRVRARKADGDEVLRGLYTLGPASGAEDAQPGVVSASRDGSEIDPGGAADGNDAVLQGISAQAAAPLYALLPHAGRMCLLDVVQRWDGDTLQASAADLGAANPMSLGGRLHGLAALEYAAQACALHGALLGRLDPAGEAGGTTVLAGIQQLRLQSVSAAVLGTDVQVDVRCVLRQSRSAIYECAVTDSAGRTLAASLGLVLAPAPGPESG